MIRPRHFVPFVLVLVLLGGAVWAEEDHDTLTWEGPGTCLECHTEEATEVHGSVMYQWQGDSPQMTTGPSSQGKIAGGVNSYCVNILGNWGACGNCHIGLGAMPGAEPTTGELENIDCLICHQEAYRRKKDGGVFVPDTEAMSISMDVAVRTVHEPTRFNCLQCHAKAGGGDAVKRGDLSLAHANTTDAVFDVHMATTGEDLLCQDCHTFTGHRVAGRGSDIRPTDSAVVLECTNCHPGMATPSGHEGSTIDRHTARLACQTCHIPSYAKNASDSAATEATEVHRTWLDSHSTAPPFHPAGTTSNDLVPRYRWWNRQNQNYLLHDEAVVDPVTGKYPTSRPIGHPSDSESKLFPFKYKTAQQPITNATNRLIALDTSIFFATGDAAAATEQGLVNMGLGSTEPYSWIETDTFQMLNHEVSPHGNALRCGDCHGPSARIDLQADFGYELRGPESTICTQCHGPEDDDKDFEELHEKHVKDKDFDCSWCHAFNRAERSLTPSPLIFTDGFNLGNPYAWTPAN